MDAASGRPGRSDRPERRGRRERAALPDLPEEQRHAIELYLKERVYATITGLAIVLVLLGEVEHLQPGKAAGTLALGVAAITAAGYLADVVAHLATRGTLPDRDEQRVLLRVATGALGTVGVPLLLIGLAAAGAFELERALRIGTVVYLVTLGLVAYLAVGRSRLRRGQKLLVLAVFVGLGALVVGVQILAHGG